MLLDDYHLIEARDIQDGMAFLLEQLPPSYTSCSPAVPTRRCQ
ncbi:MAG TPA: hypothetical protein VIT65_01505 [Microlunatus sp.]